VNSYVAGTLRVPIAACGIRPRRPDTPVTARGACLLHGFTLLEIILALAILAGSLAALGEVMRLSDQTAQRTGDETEAQILADSVMAQLESGYLPFSAVDGAQFDQVTDPPWVYSIALEPTRYNELVMVRVAVEQQLPAEKEPAQFELVRWTLNPDFVSAVSEESSTTASSSGTSTSSTTTSGSTGGSATGGEQ
jgi:general secretion pathway protein I